MIQAHTIPGFMFLGALCSGLAGARIMIRTKYRLGSRSDRFVRIVRVTYTLIWSPAGICAYMVLAPL